jgi:CheY-like chemotaxis protein
MVGLAFHRKGFEVIGAENGEVGLRKAREENPDLVVLDVMLPDISGFEVCQRLHKDPATRDLPVLLLTAKVQTDDKLAGFDAGAEDYVTKPFEMPELVARVELILSRAERLRTRAGRVITFLGAKGGVGTTTVAVNVGLALAGRGKSTVLADFRPYAGTVCHQLGLSPRRTIADLAKIPPSRLNSRAVDLSLEPHHSGLRVLAPPSQPLADDPSTEAAESLFESLRSVADFIVIDALAYPSPLSRLAFTRSDVTAIVSEPHSVSLSCAVDALSFLATLGLTGDWVGIILVHRSRSPFSTPPGEVQNMLKARILGIIPSAEEACLGAERQRVPLILAQPDHAASAALFELADRLSANRIVAPKW